MANEHVKRYSMPLITKKMQLNPQNITSYPLEWLQLTKMDSTECCQDVEKTNPNTLLVLQPSRNITWQLLRKLNNNCIM